VDVLKEELRKNRELQENVKQLQGDVDKFQDSEAMRKARAAYEHARVRGILRARVFYSRIDNWVYLTL
jgi:import inner membrane translocase subunit TIM44